MTENLAQHWDAAYAEGDERRSWREDEPAESLQRIAACRVDADAPVIDVGGGSSGLAGRLLDEGFADVTVLDISDAAMELARARLGPRTSSVRWIATDLLDWRPARSYGLWHDRAVLHFFTEPQDRARYAALLRSALAPGGFAVIAGFAPDGPDRCSGLPVRRASAEDVLDLLGDGFAMRHAGVRAHRTPGGSVQPFSWLVAERTGSRGGTPAA